LRRRAFSVSTEGSKTMLRHLIRVTKRIGRTISRAVTAFAKRIAERLHQAWTSHGQRVATDATYAAVTATVLGWALGLVPVKDVVAAVLSAVLGVYMTNRPGNSRDVNRWSDGWDLG
jgi:uncharacterized membrane protein